MRRIAVIGARPPKSGLARDQDLFRHILADVRAFVEDACRASDITIVSGGAAGVDTEARNTAVAMQARVIVHRPDYTEHRGAAPLVRNFAIVRSADELHAWPAPWSRGSWDAVRKAMAMHKPVTLHRVQIVGGNLSIAVEQPAPAPR